ncbi:hypothetical protein E2562_035661 [Oryza meyeriana var. granulata]|uniref:Uncharacterized protein n=1 Tax=Oryza meyeriana var. granulata TaxID=110450 RepID=A0A6G1E6Y9_9ORYZ|nr:hypothetical protein E2562_035661 [Oryza meyeriana var. granulata]
MDSPTATELDGGGEDDSLKTKRLATRWGRGRSDGGEGYENPSGREDTLGSNNGTNPGGEKDNPGGGSSARIEVAAAAGQIHMVAGAAQIHAAKAGRSVAVLVGGMAEGSIRYDGCVNYLNSQNFGLARYQQGCQGFVHGTVR